jgi:hypothetical protein
MLQERLPHLVPLKNPPIEKAEHVPWARQPVAPHFRRYITPHTLSPRTHLLSNGSYAVMLTNAGGGYSRRQGLAITRWREGCHDRRLGQLHLRARPREWRRLVDHVPPDPARARRLRSDLRRRSRHLPPR